MVDGVAQTRVPTVFEDPTAVAVSDLYAGALVRAFTGDRGDAIVEEFGEFVSNVYEKVGELRNVLTSGMVNRDAKIALLDRMFTHSASPEFLNFLKVLARHDRFGLLPRILRRVIRRREEESGRRRIQVTSAFPLNQDQLNHITAGLASSLPFTPIVEVSVDPSMLGGLKIRVGDTIHDASLRARLARLRERLHQRSLHEIQSGRDRFSTPAGD
jgi:F-type H+-transporting ATPase subunit delta